MSYKIEEIPGEPIILASFAADFSLARDATEAVDTLTPILDSQPTPVFYVSDARDIKTDFGDMVGLMGFVTKGNTAFLKHPNIREVVIITSSDLLKLGAKALGQQQYGGVPVSVFGSPEEAFEYMRTQITV